MSEQEWLDGLKVGDEVVIRQYSHRQLARVTGASRTRVKIAGWEYTRKDGKRYGGDGWSTSWIEMPTPETRHELRVKEIRYALKDWMWSEVPDGKLFRIEAILKEQPNPPATPDPQAQ